MTVFTKKGEAAVLANIASMPPQHRELAERLHRVIRENGPSLEPVVRWGLAFYRKDGKDVCYLKSGDGFLAFGFAEVVTATREDGASMHPVAWVVTTLDKATEARVGALVRKAAA